MHVDDDDVGDLTQLVDERPADAKRIVDRRHENASHDVEDTHGDAIHADRRDSGAGRPRRIVCRAQDAIGPLEVLAELALVEDVVTARDDVDPAGEELLGGLRGEAEATRRILAVRDAEVDRILLPRQRDMLFERLSPRCADDVADDENPNRFGYERAEAFAFFPDFKK